MDDAECSGGGEGLLEAECRAVVIIPVRDEVGTLGATLDALADQVDLGGRPLDGVSYEVIVLANNCRDGSADLARRYAVDHPRLRLRVAEREFEAPRAHVGTARRWLMDRAAARLLGAGRPRGVVASTDGDTRVASNWLAETWDAIDRGADAVGGDIRTDRAGRRALDPHARRSYLRDVRYRRLVDELASRLAPDPADPWPRHHHHTGASLAVTAEAYRRVGGLPPLPCREDVALVAALARAGCRIRHAPRVRVATSTRRLGRASGGMADTLLGWSGVAEELLVEDPAMTEALLLDPGADRPHPSDGAGLVPISVAIAALRCRLAGLRRAGDPIASIADFLEQVDPVGGLPSPVPMF